MGPSRRVRVRPIRMLVAGALLLALLGTAAAAGAGAAPGGRIGWATIMSEDFEGAFPGDGWAVSGAYYWAPRDCKPHNGTYSAWAVGGSGGSGIGCGGWYPNNLNSWMTYGPFDLTGYAAAELEFWYWVNSQGGSDWFRLLVSGNGTSWSNLLNTSGELGLGWQQATLNLNAWAEEGPVWIRFAFDTDNDVTKQDGAYVDDIVLRGQPFLTANFRSVAANDGWVRESSEDAETGGATGVTGTCRAGDDDADRQYRSILDFGTGKLPDGAVVTSAVLEIKKTSLVGDSWSATHGALVADIRRGPFNKVTALEAADFAAPANINGFGSFAFLGSTPWLRVTLNQAALAKVNLVGRTQFRVRYTTGDDDDGAADYLAFACGDAAVARSRPVLRVTYYVP